MISRTQRLVRLGLARRSCQACVGFASAVPDGLRRLLFVAHAGAFIPRACAPDHSERWRAAADDYLGYASLQRWGMTPLSPVPTGQNTSPRASGSRSRFSSSDGQCCRRKIRAGTDTSGESAVRRMSAREFRLMSSPSDRRRGPARAARIRPALLGRMLRANALICRCSRLPSA